MVAIGQTVTVVNKSGKVVSTSKHLVNVFKEAKSAYLEKKAELKANRDGPPDADHRKPHIKDASAPPSPSSHKPGHSDSPRRPSRSHTPSHRQSHHGSSSHRHHSRHSSAGSNVSSKRHPPSSRHGKPSVSRGYSDSYYADELPRRTRTQPPSPLSFMADPSEESKGKELVRRHSASDLDRTRIHESRRSSLSPSGSDIDPDLAYGELPPPLPAKSRAAQEEELRIKMSAVQRILEEAKCLEYSATAIIKNLQENPDAMAAVALTMAEISNIAAKLGPAALTGLKGAFPAVIALLASPEFLIAAGVGVGLTVVCLGGYKIVKRIKAKKAAEREANEAEEMEEVSEEVNHIEQWRQGLADVETMSVGTSVEGELITPGAARDLRERGLLPSPGAKSEKSGRSKSKKEKKNKDKDLSSKEDTLRSREAALAAKESALKSKEKELDREHKAKDKEIALQRRATEKEASNERKKREKAEKDAKARERKDKEQSEKAEKDARAKERKEREKEKKEVEPKKENALSALLKTARERSKERPERDADAKSVGTTTVYEST